jgi:hypothetical protein
MVVEQVENVAGILGQARKEVIETSKTHNTGTTKETTMK